MFWFLVLLMIVAALLIILRRPSATEKPLESENKQALLEVYRQRFEELEKERADDILSEQQHAASRLELERALLQESEGLSNTGAEQRTDNDRLLNLAVMILLPLLTLALYYKLGQPELVDASGRVVEQAGRANADDELPSIEELVVGLEKKLQDSPDDERGLWMLTRTYMAMGRIEEALVPVSHLYQLGGDEPAVMLLYANVLMLNNNESFAGEPSEVIDKALELEPENTTGLWLAGMAALELGDRDKAIMNWQKLLPLVAGDEGASQQIRQLLQEAGASLPEVAGNTKPGIEAAVSVEVSLAKELQDQVGEDDTLFVIARAEDGLPMPVAAQRFPASSLPLTITLSDETAMMPTRKLSAFEKVSVIARISRSGNAIAVAGDLSSQSREVDVASKDVIKLQINEVLK